MTVLAAGNAKKSLKWIAAGGLFFVSKFSWIIGLLKLAKFGSLISLLISLGTYALVYGWKFGAAIIYLLFAHEMGHLWAAKLKGIPTSKAFFIPFVGALINLKKMPQDAKTEAFIAYGGPLAGTIAFLPCIGLFWLTHEPFWALAVSLGSLLNLSNLLPVSPLDGGRIVTVLSTKIWGLGLAALAVAMFIAPNPMMFLIFLFGCTAWWTRLRDGFQIQLRKIDLEKLQLVRKRLEAACESEDERHEVRLWMIKRTAALQTDLPHAKGFLFPVIHDQKRLSRYRLEQELKYLVNYYPNLWEPSLALQKAEAEMDKIQSQIKTKQTYYVANAKTKWIWAGLYLSLAAFLFVTYEVSKRWLH